MVLSVFGDESADETRERVFAISGLIGAEAEWRAAEESWLALTKGEVFHAADWERAARHDEYKALALALAASPIAGIAYAIDLVAFNTVYPNTLHEAPYLKCFARLVRDAAANAIRFNESGQHPAISKLEFTFDNRRETEYSAARLYSNILEEPNWSPAALMASKVSFESRTNPRIQMADMIARECMKDLDRVVGPKKYPERRSKVALAQNGHFRFFTLRSADFERACVLCRVGKGRLQRGGVPRVVARERRPGYLAQPLPVPSSIRPMGKGTLTSLRAPCRHFFGDSQHPAQASRELLHRANRNIGRRPGASS